MVNKLLVSGLLFDLDGTLIDTIQCVEKHWRIICAENNVDAKKLLEFSHGVQTIKVLQKFFPKEMVNETGVAKVENVIMNDSDGVFAVDGAREFLDKIPASKWGIVTSGTELMASTRLNQMKLPIPECFFPAERVLRSKPDPEGYTKAAQFLGLDPRDCIVFEDALAGVQAGSSAGSTVIGILSDHTSEKQLVDAGASFCIKSYNDLEVTNENGKIAVSLKIKD